MSPALTLLALLFISINTSSAQGYNFNDPTCKVLVDVKKIQNDQLFDLFSDLVKKKKMVLTPFPKNKKLLQGELYLELTKELDGFIYKDCTLSLALKRSKTNFPHKKDKTLYKAKNRRQFPRLTFGGKERCQRALKDAFVHIPTCLKK